MENPRSPLLPGGAIHINAVNTSGPETTRFPPVPGSAGDLESGAVNGPQPGYFLFTRSFSRSWAGEKGEDPRLYRSRSVMSILSDKSTRGPMSLRLRKKASTPYIPAPLRKVPPRTPQRFARPGLLTQMESMNVLEQLSFHSPAPHFYPLCDADGHAHMWNRSGVYREGPATMAGEHAVFRPNPEAPDGPYELSSVPAQRGPNRGKLFQRGLESDNFGIFSQGPKYMIHPPNVWNKPPPRPGPSTVPKGTVPPGWR